MKNVMTSLVLLLSIFSFGQSKSLNGMVVQKTTKVENISIIVTVDSAMDVENSFKIEDIKKIIESSDDDEIVSFKIICNGETMSNGKKSNLSYKVEGKSNAEGQFIKSVEKIRTAAINYYHNKD
ncbi:MAG: hypothetical protein AB8B52_09590 [Winogradskyella sp.]|uniref:hypothetical protein n=1 Tax=Winogradskyella sp. TaxID=1883156 RepID=UPI003859E787